MKSLSKKVSDSSFVGLRYKQTWCQNDQYIMHTILYTGVINNLNNLSTQFARHNN